MSDTGRRRAALRAVGVLAAALAVVLAGVVVLAGTAAPTAAVDVRVRHTLFGMHDATSESLPRLREGAVRLWDVGVPWDRVETRRGVFDWTRLDDLVTRAQAAHAQVTMVVAMTPSFYASDPTRPPRVVRHYRDFVRALMHRYRDFHGSRGISAYQVWNEANVSNFWTGTPHQMAKLTRAMDRVRDRADPHATVVAPALAARLPYQFRWLERYAAQRLGSVPVWRSFDVVSLNLYPLASYRGRPGGPEDVLPLLRRARSLLRRGGVPSSKPVWNTEVNYGLESGADAGQPATPISGARQASFVMRTYLLNAAAGVERVYWYRYQFPGRPAAEGGGTLANTLLSQPGDAEQLTMAGRAYVLAQDWMHGRLVGSRHARPCRRDRHGTYTCIVRDARGTRRIYWNPRARAKVRLAHSARQAQSVTGSLRTVTGGSRLTVDYRPVMVSR